MKSPEALALRFRESNLKVTPQRLAVFEVLGDDADHLTAQQVHRRVTHQMPKVSLRTVYQILGELTDLGELSALDLGTGSIRYDHNLAMHHHLVCNECDAVIDIPAHLVEVRLIGMSEMGIDVSGSELVLRGTCPGCSSESDSSSAAPLQISQTNKSQTNKHQ